MEKYKKAPARAKAVEEEYFLTTKLFCGSCKAAMTGVSGTSKTGAIHQYYACAHARGKKRTCTKKTIQKSLVEEKVIDIAEQLLTPSNMEMIAETVGEMCEAEQENHAVKRLKRLLDENQKQSENILTALKQGKAIDILVSELEKLSITREELKTQLAQEELAYIAVTKVDVLKYLQSLCQQDKKSNAYKRALIDVFIDKVILHDTEDGVNKKITVLCNTQNGAKEIPLDELEGSPKGHKVGLEGLEPPTKRL